MPKKVLLIDYEPLSVERIRALLAPPEYSLSVAKDGEEGLAVSDASPFDTILVAGMLPRLPSAEVIREIRRKGGATAPPILLMVSGYRGSNTKADAQRVGAFDIVVRPFTDEALQSAVRAAVESNIPSARTVRIPTKQMREAEPGLTSDDIFSDVLHDMGDESPPAPSAAVSPPPVVVSPPPVAVPVPSAAASRPPVAVPPPSAATPPRATVPAPSTAEEQVEKRLRDTLSGMLPKGAAGRPAPAPVPTPAPGPAPPRFSTDADIDRMISDTLSGMKGPSKSRTASPADAPVTGEHTPPPATPPPSAAPRRAAVPPPASPRSPDTSGHVVSSGPDHFGQYEILEKIAAGGMAELSKARLSGVEGFQKIVAIKKILPHLADNEEFITMFADEAKLAAQLNHSNIVHIFDLGKIAGGGYFIAMEYVDGRDLRALLQSAKDVGSPIPTPLAVYVASKVAAALDYAHRRKDADGHDLNIVHRDVSPANILISYEGDIKLCDFGIAKAASKASETQSGALKGKVQYMSPEQAWGRPLDRRSDIFSLGCVLFEMLTEQKLFRGDTELSLLEKVRAARVVAPSTINPEVPKSLDAIVLKSLALEPEDRYSNASDLLRDLEAVLYSYTPAPGSADLAIYLHRLQGEETSARESRDREAAGSAAPPPEKKKKPKIAPARRVTDAAPKIPAHAAPPPAPPALSEAPPAEPGPPGVFGAFSEKRLEQKSRTPLYAMIGGAVVILAVGAYWVSHRSPAPGGSAVRATPLPVAAVPTAAPAPPVVVSPISRADAKAEEEAQRLARKKELQKSLEAQKARDAAVPTPLLKKTAEAPAAPAALAPPVTAAPIREPTPEPARPEPTVREAAPEPTAAPPPPVRSAPAVPEAREEVNRGDLVGPGAGVVEPALLSTPRVVYPALARQQRAGGRVIVLVLVDEDGAVAEARLQQGLPSKSGVNEAVVEAVRASKFRPATKNGIPVKMWRTVVVEVKP